MKTIRKYLLQNTELMNLLLNKPSIYFIEKPLEAKEENYIIYKDKIVNGTYVKDYQLEFQIVGKDLPKLLLIKDKLIELLDDYKGEKIIKDDNTIIKFIKLLNGGGVAKNTNDGNYYVVVFFLYKI